MSEIEAESADDSSSSHSQTGRLYPGFEETKAESSITPPPVVEDPRLCSISYYQLLQFHDKASRFFGPESYPTKTMRDICQCMLIDHCNRTGKCYALDKNPKGLAVKVFVTHAWDEPFVDFVESILDDRVPLTSLSFSYFEGPRFVGNLAQWLESMVGKVEPVESVESLQETFNRAVTTGATMLLVTREEKDVPFFEVLARNNWGRFTFARAVGRNSTIFHCLAKNKILEEEEVPAVVAFTCSHWRNRSRTLTTDKIYFTDLGVEMNKVSNWFDTVYSVTKGYLFPASESSGDLNCESCEALGEVYSEVHEGVFTKTKTPCLPASRASSHTNDVDGEDGGLLLWNKMEGHDPSNHTLIPSEVGPPFHAMSWKKPIWSWQGNSFGEGDSSFEEGIFGNGLCINPEINRFNQNGASFFAMDLHAAGLQSSERGTIELWLHQFNDGDDMQVLFTTRDELTGHYGADSGTYDQYPGECTASWPCYESMQIRFWRQTKFNPGAQHWYAQLWRKLDQTMTPEGTEVMQVPHGWTNYQVPEGRYHIALSWDVNGIEGTQDTVRMHLNGNVAVSSTATWDASRDMNRYLYLGTHPNSGKWTNFYHAVQGIYDNIKVWNYAKTDFSGSAATVCEPKLNRGDRSEF